MKASASSSTDTADGIHKQADQTPAEEMSGRPMLLNVGGFVMAFPRDVLLCEGLRDTCLAVLLNRFDSWMITDDNRIHFVDADPFYFIWLAEKLRCLSCNRIDVSEIIEGCPALAFYHDRFFAKTAVTIEPQHGDHDSEAFRGFMAVMGPFISSSVAGRTGGSEVLSVRVADGGVVATTEATLADYSILHDRFIKYGPVADVSADTFHKVVDYVRRIRLAPDAVTPLPTSSWPDELLYACDMYGLMERVYLSTIGKSHSHIKCLFKSSSDGGEFGSLGERVAGVSGLLFVIEDEKQHTIACHIDGPLIPPADPTSTLTIGCPVTLYSINGPFEEGGIAKISVPHNKQCVEVAGAEGTVKSDQGGAGKVCIAAGRLWLGYGEDGRPAGDLRRCHQWVERDELPDDKTYVGKMIEEGVATLAASDYYFTAQRLEVYQVWSTLPADPILPADDLQALIDTTRHIGMTAQLLYKGERDGWAYETMLAKVGGAADLLLVAKDTGSHTFATHCSGQLKQPADPTGVAWRRCPVTFYSISGAFEEPDIAKITMPNEQQRMGVAGTEGAVKNHKGLPWAKVSIAGGRLWLGIGGDAPAGDLRRCQQWVERDELPDDKTYVGSINEQGRSTLAASHCFTCVDLEIYTLQVPDGWQWLAAVADIVLSQSP
ncbi:unnamed protein product [Vitrella brassicaformis CCMP3155]|uniref:Potassium channel tetramerisation-type BTB domain-containing protein n=1 Tax=Vitrella brassicaformis (strain CCMP3155) TaxID=1169540 RepID=A0A0G4EUY4_VITBC|nr:unnamed protein product [Vitrella brassicaformis CCMP3155]|eukprot:CEM02265.1 unnamed protein product [Vitrella brassicaformis CCMP3155]